MMENLDEAWENIEKAKNYFVGYSQVLSLAGVIAFKKENLEVAEKNLKEALELDLSNCEASYYLGKVYTFILKKQLSVTKEKKKNSKIK